jgi:tetratricopeptide (TPR) repeat protein
MSPEQFEGKDADHRSDLYALGVTLYELLSGQPAFKAPNPAALMRNIIEQRLPSVSEFVAGSPPELDLVIQRATHKDPEQRYQTARELLEDLEEWLESGRVPIAAEEGLDDSRVIEDGQSLFEETTVIPERATVIPPLPPIPGLDSEPATPPVSKVSERTAPPRAIRRAVNGEPPTQAEVGLNFIIHHVGGDAEWAEWIDLQLDGVGYETERIIWDNQNPHEALRQVLKKVDKGASVISLVSPQYLTTISSDREWSDAVAVMTLKPLPMMVANCGSLTHTFRTYQYIDVVKLPREKTRELLLTEALELQGKPRAPKVVSTEQPVSKFEPANLAHNVWNIPYDSDMDFTGRGTLLTQMYEALTGPSRTAVLFRGGLQHAGMGATRAAVEYAYLNRVTYTVVWWIRAEEKVVLRDDYAKLAVELELPEKDSAKQSIIIEAVKSWLATHTGWLLVFDGAPKLQAIESYLPTGHPGHVLVTSSSPEWPARTHPLPVGPLERAAASEILFRRAKIRNEGAASALASSLGDVPLALTIAGAYVEQKRINYDQYIDLFLDRHRKHCGPGESPRDAQSVIETALALSIEAVEKDLAAALEVLKVFAYLAPTPLLLSRLISGAKQFPRSASKSLAKQAKLQEAMSVLKRYKLIAEKDDAMLVHRAIQGRLIKWLELDPESAMGETYQKTIECLRPGKVEAKKNTVWMIATVDLLLDLFPAAYETPESVNEGALLLPHMIHVIRHATRGKIEPKRAGELLMRFGSYLDMRGDYTRAEESYKRAIEYHQAVYGPTHLNIARLFEKLGGVYRGQSEYRKARAHYEQALSIQESAGGKGAGPRAMTLQRLGNLCMDMEQLSEARHYYRNALKLHIKIKGMKSEAVCQDYTNLGLAAQELKDYTEAWEHFGQALQIADAVFHGSHPTMSAAVKNMAGLLQQMGDLKNARIQYKRAVEIDTELYGPHHQTVAQNYNNLGMVLQGLGDLQKAYEHYAHARTINEQVYGTKHPKVAINLINLANILRSSNKLRKAERYYRRAVRILNNVYGENHSHTQQAVKNLTTVRAQIEQNDSGPKVV